MRETLYEFCVRTGARELLLQWDCQRNAPDTPHTVSYGSGRKVRWRCQTGHPWQASVCSRTGSAAGCPVCAGKVPVAGETDLATLFPHLAAQWHPTKNLPLTPQQVLPGSHRAVWWQCQLGHVWKTKIKARAEGAGCPVCAGRRILPGENDLAALFPDLAGQWHPSRNGPLSPSQVAPGTHKKVWWLCEKGHAWQASVASRTQGGSGCPVCSGRQVLAGDNDLASSFPAIAAQWHREKNGPLLPCQVTPSSNRKVWWCCEKNHPYQAAISARVFHGSGCPYCAGKKVWPGFNDLATVAPQVAGQWHPALNGTLTPAQVTAGSHKKIWWQCALGHVWKAAVYSRTGAQQCGCPVCAGRVRPREDYDSIAAPAGTVKWRETAFEQQQETEQEEES